MDQEDPFREVIEEEGQRPLIYHQFPILKEDPWKIKKVLTQSDVGQLCRLMLSKDLVKEHILPYLEIENVKRVESCGQTLSVIVTDIQTNSTHQLQLKRWASGAYVLIGNWSSEFVRRRTLEAGNNIGFFYDSSSSMFVFNVLRRLEI